MTELWSQRCAHCQLLIWPLFPCLLEWAWIFRSIKFTKRRKMFSNLFYTHTPHTLPILEQWSWDMLSTAYPADSWMSALQQQLPAPSWAHTTPWAWIVWTSTGVTARANAHSQIFPICVTLYLTHSTIFCNCSEMSISHVFWPDKLFKWSPNHHFLSSFSIYFWFLPCAISFLPWESTICLLMKAIPPPLSKICLFFSVSFFPAPCQCC